MMRQKILNALLIASFGAVAATASAQTSAPQNDTPRNAPAGTTAAPPAGTTSGGTMAPSPAIHAPGTTMDRSVPTDMSGYKGARAACDKQPVASKDQCRTELNLRYSAVSPKCQKLSGTALDDCLKGADTAQ
jgi:hypothetical protein